jgi:uncharacterized OB-fold protein
MKRVIMMLSASGFVLALAMASWAQVKVLPTHTVTIAGTVETIDHAKRVVTIRTPTDAFVTIDVPEGAKRFDEVKVGDKVKATYNNNVTVRLKPPGEPAVDTTKVAKTGGEGERPGGMASMERTMTATIAAIDKPTSSITFVGPNEWKYSRHVVDPKVFDQVKVGDRVDITWITDVTVAVLSEAPSVAPPAMAAGVSHLVLEVPTTSTQNREFVIVAEVRDSAGQPVNGVPVEFSVVEPDWQKNISFTPQRSMTEDNGGAPSLVVANMTGIVHITARAGDQAMTARITVSGAGSTGAGR